MLLAIDPGLRGSGAAVFTHHGLLWRAAYIEGSKDAQRAVAWNAMVLATSEWQDRVTTGGNVERLAIEWQKVYTSGRSKGDPQDLLNLSAITGAFCLAYRKADIRVYLPAEHKGQVPKEIVHERARKRLSPDELSHVDLPKQKSLAHNCWDAVAIGLVHLKRL